MSALAPIDWETIEDAIQSWFVEATGLDAVNWANQDAPQPPYPYAILNVVSGPTKVGGEDEVRTSTPLPSPAAPIPPVLAEYCGPREMTVSCQVSVGQPFDGVPSAHARALASAAQAALGMDGVRDKLRAAGLSVIQELPVQSFDVQIADVWVARSSMDVRFGLASSVEEKVQAIELVHIESPLGVDGNFGG